VGLLFKNNAETTLSSGINNSTTTVPVASAAVFPTPDSNNVFFATIDDGTNVETVRVTGISSNDLTVVRAQDNTSAAAFSTGAKIELRLNAKVLEMGTSSLTDLDGDTQVLVEEAADEDKIKFKTAGTEIARIDSTGLGIGGINPTKKFHVSIAGDASLFDRTGSAGGVMQFANGGTVKGNVGVQSGGFGLGGGFRDPDLFITTGGVVGIGTVSPTAKLDIKSTGATSTALRVLKSDAGQNLHAMTEISGHGRLSVYDSSENEDIRLDSNGVSYFNGGNLAIGATSASSKLTVDGDISNVSGDMTIDVVGDIVLDAGGENIKFSDDGTEIGQIDMGSQNLTFRSQIDDKDIIFRGQDGTSEIVALTLDMSEAGAATFNNNVTAFSDERLKDNIETLENGLGKVEQLRGVTYTRDEKENIGVIAQEVEKILPEVVLTADDEMGTKSVDYSRLTAVLIEAVKDLSARVKELEGK
tara:strand:+ start:69 stop:1484 length:1416 start_codon:yes stop_codon:yes gene_type:complete